MDRILLQVQNKRDRHSLEDWLSGSYEIVSANTEELLREPFDLAIVDGQSLKRLSSKIGARRKAEEPGTAAVFAHSISPHWQQTDAASRPAGG